MNTVCSRKKWTTVITPYRGLFSIPFAEIYSYRGLILLLAYRDFISLYKQTILGSLWYFFQPLLQTIMFMLVFTTIAKIATGNIPPLLFYLSGAICWRYFSECVMRTSDTFISQQYLFEKVYFPRLVVPIARVITNFIGFFMGFLLFFIFYFLIYRHYINITWYIILLPVLILEMAALGLGIGCLCAGLTSKYRDLQILLDFCMQVWMYISCIFYPISIVPAKWLWLYHINPMVIMIESFRKAMLGVGDISNHQILISILVSLIILSIGLLVFNKVEQSSIDTA